MPKFFVNKVEENKIIITGEDVNHIKNVLRKKAEDTLEICNNETQENFLCRIENIKNEEIVCSIIEKIQKAVEPKTYVHIYQGLPKSDKMELIIQKAVELGVYEIVPVATKRSVVKLDDKKATKKIERWNMIAQSAAKQSKRSIIPKVSNVMSFSQALTYASELEMNIIPYENADGIDKSREIIKSIKGKKSLGIFIGPEGGFEEKEVEKATGIGTNIVTLGKRILRTETAGMAVMSIIMFEIEE